MNISNAAVGAKFQTITRLVVVGVVRQNWEKPELVGSTRKGSREAMRETFDKGEKKRTQDLN